MLGSGLILCGIPDGNSIVCSFAHLPALCNCARIFIQSMGEPSRNRVVVAACQASPGGIGSLESILGLLKSLKDRLWMYPQKIHIHLYVAGWLVFVDKRIRTEVNLLLYWNFSQQSLHCILFIVLYCATATLSSQILLPGPGNMVQNYQSA